MLLQRLHWSCERIVRSAQHLDLSIEERVAERAEALAGRDDVAVDG